MGGLGSSVAAGDQPAVQHQHGRRARVIGASNRLIATTGGREVGVLNTEVAVRSRGLACLKRSGGERDNASHRLVPRCRWAARRFSCRIDLLRHLQPLIGRTSSSPGPVPDAGNHPGPQSGCPRDDDSLPPSGMAIPSPYLKVASG